MDLKYKRILLKLSGEALSNEGGFGLNFVKIQKEAEAVIIWTEPELTIWVCLQLQ